MKKILFVFCFFVHTVFAQTPTLVKDIYPGTNGSLAYYGQDARMANLNGTLIFGADNGTVGAELWKSDGTSAGTDILKDISSFGFQGGTTNSAVVLGNYLYFSSNDDVNGTELWRTDGTTIGTVLFKDIRGGSSSSNPGKLKTIGSKIYFQASTAANGNELWQTDGTVGNTISLPDIASGATSSNPNYFTEVNGKVFSGLPVQDLTQNSGSLT